MPTSYYDYPEYPETLYHISEYWKYLDINECAGWGIRNYPSTGGISLGCGEYWNYNERVHLLNAIQEAEARMRRDRWLSFPVRRYFERAREVPYTNPIYLGKYVRQVGLKTTESVETVALTLSPGGIISDPVEFDVTVDFTDINELVLFYPGTTKYEIRPLEVSISGTTATVKVPRCRLLKYEYHHMNYNSDNERPNYETDANFVDAIDVARVYTDASTGVNIGWYRRPTDQIFYDYCLNFFDGGSEIPVGSQVLQLVSPHIQTQRNGFVTLEPATYADGTWTKARYTVNRKPDFIQINFMRGYYEKYERMESNMQRILIAIAHNDLPQQYCHKCDVQLRFWREDTQPLEPPVSMGLGPSTWGIYRATQLIREFDYDRNSHHGGLL